MVFLQFANKNYSKLKYFLANICGASFGFLKKSTPRHTSQRSGQATLISNITNEIKRVLLSTYSSCTSRGDRRHAFPLALPAFLGPERSSCKAKCTKGM